MIWGLLIDFSLSFASISVITVIVVLLDERYFQNEK